MRIGIVGGGFVGSATALLKCSDIDVIVYDLDPARCMPPGCKKEDLRACDLVFVCVPTPSYDSGECNTVIVERAIAGLKEIGIQNIVLRSTVPPGTSERLGVMFMPEFLTEANWPADFHGCKLWVFGCYDDEQRALLQSMLDLAQKAGSIQHNNAFFTNCKEAEMIKYVRNNFLALKISFFNEIHSLCKAIGADYEQVRQGVAGDGRIGESHTRVPGFDGHYGYGGTCLPKDTSALLQFMTANNVESHIVKAAVVRNKTVDRPERDWELDPRAYTRKSE
jgi:UDPglucose 6-dehydrogenase